MAVGGSSTRVRFRSEPDSPLTAVEWPRFEPRFSLDGAPVRVPGARRGQRNYPGFFWSATVGKTLVYESLLELDRLWLADADPLVTGIATQPFEISGLDDGVVRSHVPDVLLQHADGTTVLVDVKPEKIARRPEVAAVFAWTAGLCRDRGWRYEVFTGANPVQVANVRFLAAGRRTELLDQDCLTHANTIAPVGEPLGSVEAGLAHPVEQARPVVLAMLWHGRWTTDLTRPLSTLSRVWAVTPDG